MDKGKTRQGGTKNCAEKFVFARYVAQTHIWVWNDIDIWHILENK
jgi:hypothetical protein